MEVAGAVVMAAESSQAGARVVGKVPLPEPEKMQTLRLEIGTGGELSGMLDNGFCMRMVGKAEMPPGGPSQVGLGAHGGEGAQQAVFDWFRALQIPGDRAHFGA